MKCPNCGAEVNGKFCAYCGSAVEQEAEENNYKCCPRCGSKNVNFKREQVKQSKRISGGDYSSVSGYNTVGFCEECGYTWDPLKYSEPKKKINNKIILWILGWICIFPVPLTILLMRNNKMRKSVKYSAIALAWAIYLLIGIVGMVNNTEEISDPESVAITTMALNAKSIFKSTAIPTPTPTSTPDPRIAMREEYSKQIDEAVANSGVKLVATGEVMTDEDKTIDNVNVYVLKWYTYNEYKRIMVSVGDTFSLLICVYDANIKTILPLVRDLAPIIDKTMVGVKGSSLDCEFEDLDIDYNNKTSTQYWSYYNSLALIKSQLGVDSDECRLTMYLNPNE